MANVAYGGRQAVHKGYRDVGKRSVRAAGTLAGGSAGGREVGSGFGERRRDVDGRSAKRVETRVFG